MNDLSIKKETSGQFDDICQKVIDSLKPIGFGVLTRIDFDQKIKEKLNEEIGRCVVLGACNPQLALEAYRQSTDTALFIPCNIVIRELDGGTTMVEAMRPLKMLDFIQGVSQSDSMSRAEQDLERVILSL
jgi:uncharacterized protein (DUF302 family)